MAVLPVKTEPRCKICRSDRRADVDTLLELRSQKDPERKKDEAGVSVNLDYVIERYAEWHNGEKLTKDNCTGHWKNHCEVVETQTLDDLRAAEAKLSNAAVQTIERILGPDRYTETPTVDQMLELQRALYLLELEAKAISGAPIGLTHDHAMKAADSSTKRRQEESTGLVLRQLGAGIGQALLGKAVGQPQLPAADEVVVEPVEEAEVE